MKKTLQVAFLTVLLAVGFGFVGTVPLSAAANSTTVDGVISSDTMWTADKSPYVFTGPVGVASGVTLTIEPNVTVNLGAYSLQISGALYARGSSDSNITFISEAASYGNIAFMNGSVGWDKRNGSGSIIENAILSQTSISINNGCPWINNNTITGGIEIDYGATPLISNNVIIGDVGIHGSSPKIDHNSIIGGINIGGNAPVITNNMIEGGGVVGIGIGFDGPENVTISNNIIYQCSTGVKGRCKATIDRNLIIDNDDGIEMRSPQILIQNNTIAENSVGIRVSGQNIFQVITITRNNIQDNKENSIYLEDTRADVDATLNWWGTVEGQEITLTIHDKKNEPKLGTVNFVPTLSAPVPEAPSTEYTPITWSPTPIQEPASTTPKQTEAQPAPQIGILEIAVAATIFSVVINVLLVVVVVRLLRKKG